MAERMYVALDLETTGLDSRRDTILEIGAFRFQGEKILDRFTTLVNPRRSIPLRVQQITGIRDADVLKAPPLERVLPELRAFIGADVAAIVAHNPGFDLGFLQANGVNLQRPALDTVELASILLPGQASYNLGELCHHLGIPLLDAHRAADDAEATARLFMTLVEKLQQLPPATLWTIAEQSRHGDWSLAPLFVEAAARHGAAGDWNELWRPLQHIFPALSPPGQTQQSSEAMFDNDDSLALQDKPADPIKIADSTLQHFFAPDGPLAQQMGSNYEMRPGQVTMAQEVLRALNTGDHLMVEAGTGVGKSLAYLLPAALWSLANQSRVLIATNTITLQDQLLEKDIPQLQALLANAGDFPPLQATILKGRVNYLCLRRFHAWRSGRQLSSAELVLLAKVLVWLPGTTTGDVNELTFHSALERSIWERICSDSTTCNPQRCTGKAEDGSPRYDFYLLAHQCANQAHLLAVNHALLLADIAAGGRVLPAHSHLIVDEAHHLEEAATDALAYRIEWPRVQALLTRLSSKGDLTTALLTAAIRHRLASAQPLGFEMATRIERVARTMTKFAKLLLQFVQHHDNMRSDMNYTQRLALDSKVRTQPEWSEIEVEWDMGSDVLRSANQACGALLRALEEARWREDEATAALFGEFQAAVNQINELAQQLDTCILAPEGSTREIVTWLEINDANNNVSLSLAPLYVGNVLEKEIVHRKRSAIFTSATLRAGSTFAFIRERLGLWDVNTAIVESPFDYKRSTLLFLPSDLVTPNHMNYQQMLERALVEAAQASQGRMLVLFTSYAHLRGTADGVRTSLDRLGITLLQHGVSNRQRLLREYRATERAVLLGTRSFWEGIDLPGDELRCLMIARLPFAVPNDPLVAARSAEFEDPFMDYTLPDAILKFRQGFGRLIRRASDRGVVVLMDSRAWRKEYGQTFLDSLPTCTVRSAPLSLLEGEMRRWLQDEGMQG